MTLLLQGSVAAKGPRLDMARGPVSAAAGLPIPAARVRGRCGATIHKAAVPTGREWSAVAPRFNTVSASPLMGRHNSDGPPAIAAETCYSAPVAGEVDDAHLGSASSGGSATGAVLYGATHCRRGHRWADGNEAWGPDGRRRCRACRALSARRCYAARQGIAL